MKQSCFAVPLVGALVLASSPPPPARAAALPIVMECPADAVLVGQLCVDKYEASVWSIPATDLSGKSNAGLINKVRRGEAKLAALSAGNAIEISQASSCRPMFPPTFPANGQWTAPLYAVSVPGVRPTACVTWFQADQACALSGKRLLTNAEWQRAAAGTPESHTDAGGWDCNIIGARAGGAADTGSRANCKSSWGAFDMVGNVAEWVSDRVPLSTSNVTWASGYNGDGQYSEGTDTSGALFRGGVWGSGTFAGIYAVRGPGQPSGSSASIGLRCAR